MNLDQPKIKYLKIYIFVKSFLFFIFFNSKLFAALHPPYRLSLSSPLFVISILLLALPLFSVAVVVVCLLRMTWDVV
jgi:hypothetical protein